VAEPGVFGVPDPVLNTGVGAVLGLQERQLTCGGVGGEGLISPPVGGFEQGELGAWMGSSRRMITRIPAGQPVRSTNPVTSTTSAPLRTALSASSADTQIRSGSSLMASRTAFVYREFD
jgi:hypothetical protein